MLDGANVVLGVTGSIAAVKTVELAHELRRQGATVRAVMTDGATGIIHPWALEFATDHPVVTEITGQVEHVDFFGDDPWADVLLIAPSTANTVGKIAAAIDDTPVTTCATVALGADVPVVIAPAMHEPMYDHPGVLDALDQLEAWGIEFVDPRVEEGKAKIATEEAIVTTVARAVGPAPLAGTHVVVTGGPTREAIDPIRILTNRSSGKTGRAVARACYSRGAAVTLVQADGADLPYAAVEPAESTHEMIETVLDVVDVNDADVVISAAALADYTVTARDRKIRSGQQLSLELEPTPKLLDRVRETHPDLPLVAFKTETGADDEALVEAARDVRDRVDAAFVVANDASVMQQDTTRVLFVEETTHEAFEGAKTELGMAIADRLTTVL
ncbi:MAG: bifunctional phosphopantothenoylcysteine decarboxylase/phosphopantothenate--cysteine ligase CoaBC [Halobacteriales archaeon]